MTNVLNLSCRKGEKLKERQRDFYVQAAIDLGYGEGTLYALLSAKTETEATRLMTTARERSMV